MTRDAGQGSKEASQSSKWNRPCRFEPTGSNHPPRAACLERLAEEAGLAAPRLPGDDGDGWAPIRVSALAQCAKRLQLAATADEGRTHRSDATQTSMVATESLRASTSVASFSVPCAPSDRKAR
jgi:hypothetical protein